MTVSIIGLGLIGGSLAKALKARTSHRVLGFDKNEDVIVSAFNCGAIDNICTDFSDTDIALISLYPAAAVEFIKANARGFKPGATIIDMCGVKRFVCESLRGVIPEDVTFIGGHPMAGREYFGFEASLATLFEGASMILTPDDDIMLDKIEDICEFFYGIGFGHIEVTSAERHDEIIAYTSQLAHIISSAYVKNPTVRKFSGFTAGSFYDMTRVAKLDENMWSGLFLCNGDYLQRHIELLIGHLSDYRDAIAERDERRLRELLLEGREIKERLNLLKEEGD